MKFSEKICVIDDDSSIRWVLEKALGNAGLQVESFDSADHALEKLSRDEPAVVVTDVRMPGMDGMELLERIGERYPELPVIIMTANAQRFTKEEAEEAGVSAFLTKPFSPTQLMSEIRKQLGDAQANN